MKYLLLIIFSLAICPTNAQVQLGKDFNGESAADYSGKSTAISADGSRMAIGSNHFNQNSAPYSAGHVQVFEATNGIWIKIGQDIIGEFIYDEACESISLSADGKRLAIGAPYNDGNGSESGHVRVFEEINGNWTQIGIDIDGEAAGDELGTSVSLSNDGTRLAIGAAKNDGNGLDAGHIRVFEEINGTWTQIGQDIDGETADELSGSSVSISADGTRVVIGAPLNSQTQLRAGQVRVYQETNGNWTQVGQDLDGEANEDRFGNSVSISDDGTRIAIGGFLNNGNGFGAGHVRMYQENNGNWTQIGQDIDGEAPGDQSGKSVSLSANGKRVAIGAPNNSENISNAGQVRIYQENNGNWVQLGLDIDGKTVDEGSGWNISLAGDGSRVVVGAPWNKEIDFNNGQTRVYDLIGTFGQVYLDLNKNCIQEAFEYGIPSLPLIVNPGNYVVQTNPLGYWGIELPQGNYTISIDTSKLWTTNCMIPQSFTVLNNDSSTILPFLGLTAKYPCPSPDVSIHMPIIRSCFPDQVIYIQACNTYRATGTIYNATVEVTLDSLISPTSFELPPTILGNNRFLFDLDSLKPNQCVDFWIKGMLDCTAQLGKAICVKAELFPIEPCVLDSIPNPFPPTVEPCIGEWDESSLTVTGYCQNNTIYFKIENAGVGDMECYSPVTVYVDGVLLYIDSVLLNAQQMTVVSFPGNGESWHLEVAQHPNHPGNSNPKATVENCGGTTGNTKINLFAQDDADPVIDIYCGEVTGSYDPNDKTGFPLGVTEDHHIQPNQQLQYRIRFQNTGTDTAFTVVIRDTLETDLDIYSVRSGVSSHSYSFRMFGPRVLEWTFNDIMLPDSNVNEPASHGFVTFTVDQLPNLPDGTQITNSVGIYFDFNEPIITNIAQHQIHYNLPITVDIEEIGDTSPKFTLSPNPGNGQFFLDLKENYKHVNITITDIAGRLILDHDYQNVAGIPLEITKGKGVYFVKIIANEQEEKVFKMATF